MSDWIRVDERTPRTYETGDWDGKRSDLVLLVTEFDDIKVGRLYEGFMDGVHFKEWADGDSWTIDERIIKWLPIPSIY